MRLPFFLAGLLVACGGGGGGQPCAIFSDCPAGQVCLSGVCIELDAGAEVDATSMCGDGVRQAGEQCDEGPGNANVPNACRPDCRLPGCGDGITDLGEQCDDGNDIIFDGCIECRVENSECLIVHSGSSTGSSFISIPLREDGSVGTPVGITTTATTTSRATHSLTACSGFLFGATTDTIHALTLSATGVPIMGPAHTHAGTRELLCHQGALFAPVADDVEVTLTRFRVGSDGTLEPDGMGSATRADAEGSVDERYVPFAAPDTVVVVGFPETGRLGAMLIARFASATAQLTSNITTAATATNGELSSDGRNLVGTGVRVADQSCVGRWSADTAGGADTNCDAFAAASSILLANEEGTRGWFSTDSFLGNAVVVGFGVNEASWNSLERLDLSAPALLTPAQGDRYVVAVSNSSVSVLVREGDRLSGPVRVAPYAALGQVRGVTTVPCVSN